MSFSGIGSAPACIALLNSAAVQYFSDNAPMTAGAEDQAVEALDEPES